MKKTYAEIYCKRIDAAKTDVEILVAFEEMKNDDPQHYGPNLERMLGYYDAETRKRWYELLAGVSHPVFGPGFGR